MTNLPVLYGVYEQSIWLDYIDRNLLIRGGLEELVDEGLRGVTSNPTIFHKAISKSEDYDDAIRDLLQSDHEMDDDTLYEWLIIQDVQMAADILHPVYVNSNGKDGYVSVEVSPHIASDADATIEASRHLWKAVDRPNLMIKVPATASSLVVIERLIAEGININVTLLFSVDRYKEVADAWIRGLSQNSAPEKVASVASFFLSRIDSKVDDVLDKIGTPEAEELKGNIAIASAKLAYQHFKKVVNSEDFSIQRQRGARPQRLLWASTSTKNPEYSDLLYVEELIGRETINTMTPETLDAFQDHGDMRASLEKEIDIAERNIKSVDKTGIDMEQITLELEKEGISKFTESYDGLLDSIKEKRFYVSKKYAE